MFDIVVVILVVIAVIWAIRKPKSTQATRSESVEPTLTRGTELLVEPLSEESVAEEALKLAVLVFKENADSSIRCESVSWFSSKDKHGAYLQFAIPFGITIAEKQRLDTKLPGCQGSPEDVMNETGIQIVEMVSAANPERMREASDRFLAEYARKRKRAKEVAEEAAQPAMNPAARRAMEMRAKVLIGATTAPDAIPANALKRIEAASQREAEISSVARHEAAVNRKRQSEKEAGLSL